MAAGEWGGDGFVAKEAEISMMKLTVIEIDDWHQFSAEIKDLGYKSWIFRGHSSVEWRLESLLWRAFQELRTKQNSYLVREKDILRTFKACAHHHLTHLPEDGEILEWWSLMQHYGAPTRLLDWTYSPYIAAFFALERAVRCDCCVYGLYIANIRNHNKSKGVDEVEHDYLSKNHTDPFVGMYSPRLRNQRLISQQGVFTVQSVLDCNLEQILEEYPAQPGKDKGKGFVQFIFKNQGPQFGDYISFLHRMNITNASLFPGIEGLGKSLRLDLMNIGSKF